MMFSFVAIRILSVPVRSSRVTPCPSASAFGGLSSFPLVSRTVSTSPLGCAPAVRRQSCCQQHANLLSARVFTLASELLTNHSERTALGAVVDLGPLSSANRGDKGI